MSSIAPSICAMAICFSLGYVAALTLNKDEINHKCQAPEPIREYWRWSQFDMRFVKVTEGFEPWWMNENYGPTFLKGKNFGNDPTYNSKPEQDLSPTSVNPKKVQGK